jgi:hypothetical protein
MCAGEFNSSFRTTIPSTVNVTLGPSEETYIATAGKQFDLALEATAPMQIGAISLILNVPSNLVTVGNVKVPGSNGPVTYQYSGNTLRIGWNSTVPINVVVNGDVVVLSLKPTSSFTSTQTLNIKMVNDPLNELADGFFTPIPNVALEVDAVRVTSSTNAPPTGLSLNAAPNPTSGATQINYSIPLDGTVVLGLYDSKGVLLKTIVPPTFQTAGDYQMTIDMNVYKKANYYLKLTLTDIASPQSITLKLMRK